MTQPEDVLAEKAGVQPRATVINKIRNMIGWYPMGATKKTLSDALWWLDNGHAE